MPPFGLGRVPSKLETVDFPMMRAFAAPPPPPPAYKTWRVRWMGDQRETSECVGYSCTALLRSTPGQHTHWPPLNLYEGARRHDEYPGEDYNGSSVKGGMKWLEKNGEIASYHLTKNWDEVIDWLARKGPVVFGTDWYEGMFTMDGNGFISPQGAKAGGHAYLIYGYVLSKEPTRSYLKVWNSWGPGWGYFKGTAKLSRADAENLLAAQGEAWGAVKHPITFFKTQQQHYKQDAIG